jgi:hypothetical protein
MGARETKERDRGLEASWLRDMGSLFQPMLRHVLGGSNFEIVLLTVPFAWRINGNIELATMV